jgi:hypothetical protein
LLEYVYKCKQFRGEKWQKSKIAKFNKQQALVVKYAQRRQELKAAGDVEGLSKLPLIVIPIA